MNLFFNLNYVCRILNFVCSIEYVVRKEQMPNEANDGFKIHEKSKLKWEVYQKVVPWLPNPISWYLQDVVE